jgi:hypothetical protein
VNFAMELPKHTPPYLLLSEGVSRGTTTVLISQRDNRPFVNPKQEVPPSPLALMLTADVRNALGASKTVMFPFASLTKPHVLFWVSSELVTSPLELILKTAVLIALLS